MIVLGQGYHGHFGTPVVRVPNGGKVPRTSPLRPLLTFGVTLLKSRSHQSGNSSVVEHNLAKVGVASSNLVSRSKNWHRTGLLALVRLRLQGNVPISLQKAGWQSGHAAACKAVYVGSIPALASILPHPSRFIPSSLIA